MYTVRGGTETNTETETETALLRGGEAVGCW